jgi:hypothetical protein
MGMRQAFGFGGVFALLMVSGWSVRAATGPGGTPTAETTQKRVRGIITSVEGQEVTIAPVVSLPSLTGRIDPKRTHIEVDGHAARPVDLEVTLSANAELGLDDVWVSIRASSR